MIKLGEYIISLDDCNRYINLRDCRHRLLYKGKIQGIPFIYFTYYVTDIDRCWLTRRIILTIIEDVGIDGISKEN